MSTISRALAFASLWFDAATIDRVFAPLVADWQREWIDAPLPRRWWLAMRGGIAFATTFLVLMPHALVSAPMPRAMVRRVIVRMSAFMIVVCGILAIPFLMELRQAPFARQAMLLGLLLPTLIAFALPFATSFIVDTVRTGLDVSHAERIAMARVALAATLVAFTFSGWVVPRFNLMVRVETRGYDLPAEYRGVRELTTWELVVDPSLAPQHEPYTGGADRSTRVRAEIQKRIYIVALPVLLVWMRWKALELRREGWLPLPASAATCLTGAAVLMLYFGTWRLEKELGLASGTSNWLSLGVLVVWGLLTPYRRRLFITGGTALQNSRIA
jgi:hypothetical protein